MSALREAAARANATSATVADAAPVVDEPDELPEVVYDDDIVDAPKVSVYAAWARVMADVKSVTKAGHAKITTDKGSYSFNYRGIDQVLNAVGPALRRHGVMVIPVKVDTTYGSSGRMREVQVSVTYDIIGPEGDAISAMSAGEGLDTGERGTTKALTNAYRNLLIAALTLPTQDPKLDPDKVNIEREEAPRPTATGYRDEALNTRTSLGRLRQMRTEVHTHGMANAVVENETGDDEKLLDLINRIGKERSGGGA